MNDALAEHVADGRLTGFHSGTNVYNLDLPGYSERVRLRIGAQPKTVSLGFGSFAIVDIDNLEIERARLRWNEANNALQLQIDFEDDPDGLIIDIRTFGVRRIARFAVQSARFNVYLTPRINADGTLGFEPLRGDAIANTDDAIPEVRGLVRDTLTQLGNETAREAQTNFAVYEDDFASFVSRHLAPRARFIGYRITATSATFNATAPPLPEDLNGNGVVDIADLVIVAQAFGRAGGVGDVNGDGVVNLVDLVLIASKFGVSR